MCTHTHKIIITITTTTTTIIKELPQLFLFFLWRGGSKILTV
jgi:hypothetical protein